MDSSIISKLWVPVLWILLQNLLIIYAAWRVLQLTGLLKKPIAGMEYSQALMAAILLFAMIGIGNASVQSYYDTCLNYASQQGPWLTQTMLRYSQYFLVTLLAEFLLLGMYWLVVRLFFSVRGPAEQTISEGNLPMAILVSGIIGGTGLGLARLVALILTQLTPHYVLLNGPAQPV